MQFLRLILAASLGGVLRALLGLALTVLLVVISTSGPADPRDPAKGAIAPLAAVILIPAGFLWGAVRGVRVAARWGSRPTHWD